MLYSAVNSRIKETELFADVGERLNKLCELFGLTKTELIARALQSHEYLGRNQKVVPYEEGVGLRTTKDPNESTIL